MGVNRFAAALGVVGLVIALGLIAAPASAATTTNLTLNMDQGSPVTISSGATVRTQVISAHGGTLSFVASRSGQGRAVSFPAYGSQRNAVIAVTNISSTDALAPGTRAFSFGADFRTVAGGKADGDNLIQRGLADDAGQYKLEVDSGVVACTMKGTKGAVTVRTGPTIVPGVWYAAKCAREGSKVTVTVTRLDTRATSSASRWVDVGSVATRAATTALTVGGKVTPAGRIAGWSPDQFNGLVDNAFVTIG